MKYTGLDQTQRHSLQIGTAPATTFTYDGTGIGPSSVQPGTAGATPDYITHTPGGGLVSLHRGGYTYFYIQEDRLGSVVAVAGLNRSKSGDSIFVANRYRYGLWGEILPQSVESVPQPFKFAGAEHDASTGLYKMGARYYNPAIGRFTQLDALGGGYPYALNDPVNLTDPTGYDPGDIVDIPPAFPSTPKPPQGPPLPTRCGGSGIVCTPQQLIANRYSYFTWGRSLTNYLQKIHDTAESDANKRLGASTLIDKQIADSCNKQCKASGAGEWGCKQLCQ
jgi:RHS repeat-associated protein